MESTDHYSKVAIQPISYILANNLDFCRGNIVKYVTRDKFKDKDKDIKKIIDYAAYILCNDSYRDWETDRKSTRLNSSHRSLSRMPSSA